jgi:uncharacterized protein YqgQ
MLIIHNKMGKSEIITEIERAILKWDETSIGIGDFGAVTFLYKGKEFGHIHKNRDLDITFGEKMTKELLNRNLVQKHLYVPKTNITYPVSNEERLPFAISLLRMCYLNHYIIINKGDTISQEIFEKELAKLPESLLSIYVK